MESRRVSLCPIADELGGVVARGRLTLEDALSKRTSNFVHS
jgi:hypothetical protein